MIDNLSIDLAKYRLNKAKDLLEQAVLLNDNEKYDGSINRFYYAIFNAIKSILALIELDSSKHSGVLSFFDRYFVKLNLLEKEYSRIAHEAFDIRQDNDYEDFYMPTKNEAVSQIDNASKFINEIESKTNLLINKKINLPIIKNE